MGSDEAACGLGIGALRAFWGTERDLRPLFQPIAGPIAPDGGASARTILLTLQASALR